MKNIKLISLGLCAALALGSIAGCNASEETTEETTKASGVTTEETTTESSEETTTTTSEETTSESSAETSESTEDTSDIAPESVDLTSDSQLYSNTFITNFVEQYFYDYDRDSAGIEQILDFIHIYIKLNANSEISYETNGDITFEVFSVEDAQTVATRYFGILLTEDDLNSLSAPPSSYGDQPAGPYYEDGKIWYEAADGEGYSRIGIVDSLTNNTDGTLTMEFTIYEIDPDTYWSLSLDDLRDYYALTPDQAAADPTLTAVSSGSATVGVAQSGDYYLIAYSTER